MAEISFASIFGISLNSADISCFISKNHQQVAEAVLHKCSYKNMFQKYAGNLQEKIHAGV